MSRLWLGWIGLCVGCAGDSDSTVDTGPPPDIRLITPSEGDTVCGTPFHLVVEVDHYSLIGFDQPESSVPGVGHVDIKLNGQNRWMTPDLDFEIPEVVDGVYLVEALLVDGEHHPIEPYVGDEAQVTVDAAACTQGDTGA